MNRDITTGEPELTPGSNSAEPQWDIVASGEYVTPKIQFFNDLIIDREGVEYKGERIYDAGAVYRALQQMLRDHGYHV